MTSSNLYIKQFPVDMQTLSLSEQAVVAKLTEAAELIARLYAQQVNEKFPGANFYSHDATREEIEKAAKTDPLILDPHTVVERRDGSLTMIPYHVFYRSLLEQLAVVLNEAASITTNKQFAERLEIEARSLTEGKYQQSEIAWLTMSPYIISVVLGPIERYEDKLFFIKTCYEGTVGIMDRQATEEAQRFRDVMVATRRKVVMLSDKVEFASKLQIRVDNVVVIAGLDARVIFTGATFPTDSQVMAQYGAEILIFKNVLDYKFDRRYYPIFQNIFDKKFQKSYSKSVLRTGALRNAVVREIARSLVRYSDAQKRLGEHYAIINEVATIAWSIKSCGSLLLKDVISQKEIEAIMVMFLCWIFDWWKQQKSQMGSEHHAKAGAVAVNFLTTSGALQEKDGFSWPNFTKMFLSMSELAEVADQLLASGNSSDGANFVNQYSSLDVFDRMSLEL